MKTFHIEALSTLVDNWNPHLNNNKSNDSLALFFTFFQENSNTFPETFYECPDNKNVKVRVAKASKCKNEKTLIYFLE